MATMGRGPNGQALRQLRTLFDVGATGGLSDGELLDRFARRRGGREAAELAFAALVERHGAMVRRTCRGVLGDRDGADDAAQGAFLVLARKARALRSSETVGPWLHRVAVQVATRRRDAEARRRRLERRSAEGRPTASPPADRPAIADDLAAVLHDELARLPESFRAPLVLCDLEGLTVEQAAARLGHPAGTIKSRRARARDRLRDRLVRRGLAPSISLAALASSRATAAVPDDWVSAVATAATLSAVSGRAGATALGLGALIRSLIHGGTQVILTHKLPIAAIGALAACLATFRGGDEGSGPANGGPSAVAVAGRQAAEGPAESPAGGPDAAVEVGPQTPDGEPIRVKVGTVRGPGAMPSAERIAAAIREAIGAPVLVDPAITDFDPSNRVADYENVAHLLVGESGTTAEASVLADRLRRLDWEALDRLPDPGDDLIGYENFVIEVPEAAPDAPVPTPPDPRTDEELVAGPALLYFHAAGTDESRLMEPLIDAVRRRGVPVRSIEAADRGTLISRYGLTSLPALIVVDRHGNELARHPGLIGSASVLERFYRSAIEESAAHRRPEEADDPVVLAPVAPPPLADAPVLPEEITGPALIGFFADWSQPCREMRPAIAEVGRRGVPVRSIDIDEDRLMVESHGIDVVPTVVVVGRDGAEVARLVGARTADELERLYRMAIGDDEPGLATARPTDPRPEEPPLTFEDRPRNPRPWETVVRVRARTPGAIGFGSGTVIDGSPDGAIILMCAHTFQTAGDRLNPLGYPYPIEVELFDGALGGPRGQQVTATGERFEGELIDADFGRDVALVRFRPGRALAASPVVPPSWSPRAGMRMTAVGCSRGQDATAWSTVITAPSMDTPLDGKPDYRAIECRYSPAQGRAGGGLFTEDGHVAGVCNFAFAPKVDRGLYAAPASIYRMLDRSGLSSLYGGAPEPPADGQAEDGLGLPVDRPEGHRPRPEDELRRNLASAFEEGGRVVVTVEVPQDSGASLSLTLRLGDPAEINGSWEVIRRLNETGPVAITASP